MFLTTTDVEKTATFMRKFGMRDIFQSESIVVLELRGGTHLLLQPTDDPIPPGTKAPFDLMVDEIDASHEKFEELGILHFEHYSDPMEDLAASEQYQKGPKAA